MTRTGQAKYRPDFRRLPGPVLNPAGFSKRRPGNCKGGGGGGWGGGVTQLKGEGMLRVSVRSVDFGFWSHLGSSGQDAIIFRIAREAILKNYLLSVRFITPFM